ncbi:MAG: SDR family oxidoreductase [Actinomycetota bacterium]
MADTVVWISGASSGIGQALARTVPWPESRVIGISRSRPAGDDAHPAGEPAIEHVEADLAQPAGWAVLSSSFVQELAAQSWDRVVFVHAAGTVEPVGFAGEVESQAYAAQVVLNAAAPQVLGHAFLAAVRGLAGPRHLTMLTSGAAKSTYPGWSAYGAGKAAVDQWVRNAGAEQLLRGGVQILAIAPGTVDTAMQGALRATAVDDFPSRQKFTDLHAQGKLSAPEDVARRIWAVLDSGLVSGSVIDLRDLPATP